MAGEDHQSCVVISFATVKVASSLYRRNKMKIMREDLYEKVWQKRYLHTYYKQTV
jgi:hypothetical protein